MASSDELMIILREALRDPFQRKELISRFQRLVWDAPQSGPEDKVMETFADLAYDLDYYEPDPVLRLEDPSYYGDERLEQEIREALRKLGRDDATETE